MDDEELLSLLKSTAVVASTVVQGKKKKRKVDHRTLPRSTRTNFRHHEALGCIRRDYLGDTPLLGKQFHVMFRMSRGRFQVLMEDVMGSTMKFYRSTPFDGETKHSLEAKLLLPIKTLAYGVPPHAFCDYFQMSATFADSCCKHFDKVIIELYMKDFLRLPTSADLKNIVKLHKHVHRVDGLFGSLDCSHTSPRSYGHFTDLPESTAGRACWLPDDFACRST